MLFKNYVCFEIFGDNISALVSRIFKNNIPCINLVNKNENLSGMCRKKYWRLICYECEKLNLEWEQWENTSIFTFFNWLRNRKGLVAGFFCGLLGVTILSNTFLQLRIKTDNDQIKTAIENYILSKGYEYGDFIPNMDIFSLELDILQDVEEVSWVGIYLTGGTLNVDVVENVEKPEYNQRRLPSNLVAKSDGQIIKAEVFGGKLVVPVGSGVHKGQLLVSGEVELSEEKTVFRRSSGNIYAKVTYEEEFFCPFETQTKVVSDACEQKNFLTFYSLEIPLGFDKITGQYQTKENFNNLNFFGLKLPVGMKKVSYYKYDFEQTTLTQSQAEQEVYKLDGNYKANILNNCEIISENEQLFTSDDGVTLKKEYVVIENIATEKEILVK